MSRLIDAHEQHRRRLAAVAPRRAASRRHAWTPGELWESLTPRQRQVLELASRPAGGGLAGAAAALGIAPQTVENTLHAAYRSLGVNSLAQAVRMVAPAMTAALD